jgi:hypothetical protein
MFNSIERYREPDKNKAFQFVSTEIKLEHVLEVLDTDDM